MNTRFFIDRPIFACCISVMLVILGIIGLKALPVEQYPDIAPPTINVTTTYNGANADTVVKSVITPIEQAINGVDDMMYIKSTASNTGNATITVYFKQGTDADMAAVNVQNRVSTVLSVLPAEVRDFGVTTQKQQQGQIKIFSLISENPDYDENFISNYLRINMVPQLKRIPGVGDAQVLGSKYALRIWLDPKKLFQFKLNPSDIAAVLKEQNLESPTGIFGNDSDTVFLTSMKYRGRFTEPEEFENIVIKSLPDGNLLTLGSVAKIELAEQDYNFKAVVDSYPGVVCLVSQAGGSNATEVIRRINALQEQIAKELPPGLHFKDLFSVQDFLDASIHEVVKTLIEAIILVVIVVFIFLQSLRATIIPLIGIIVSLVATFAFILVAGFTLNLLTLFALILVIGTVVDDSIVVVEAVQTKLEKGIKNPYKAAVAASGEIATAIFTTSLVFMAVFIPVCFMGGTSGTFYTQFGVTMAVAVGISALNALTLSPALCALLLKHDGYDDPENQKGFTYRFHVGFTAAFEKMSEKYASVLNFFIRVKVAIVVFLGVVIGGLIFLMSITESDLIPDEDTGIVFMSLTTSPGYTLNQTDKAMRDVEKVFADIPQIESAASITGYNLLSGGESSSSGTFIIRLKPWEERPNPEDTNIGVIYDIYSRTYQYRNAKTFPFAPPMILGFGVSNGIEMYIQDKQGGSLEKLGEATDSFIAELSKSPAVAAAYSSFDPRFPQYIVEVKNAVCKRRGVSPQEVLNTLSTYVAGSFVSDINLYANTYKVVLQTKPEHRISEDSLSSFYVRNNKGKMLPIRQFLTFTQTYGPELITNFNLFTSISLNVSIADGYSTSDVLKAIEEASKKALPKGYGYDFGGLTREQAEMNPYAQVIVYGMCILFIYIILCSLYESICIPLAVLMSVPSALAGAFLLATCFGVSNNIYMQTGLVMLIGLVSKTAILLTEFASELRKKGMSIVESAITAAKMRLRAILMTSLTMIAGMIPMVLASGAGANGNISLGVCVVGGMSFGILGLLITTPICFIALQYIQEKFARKTPSDDENNENETANQNA